MREKYLNRSTSIPTRLIAPCGMNCRLCRAYSREKNTCPGCRGDVSLNPGYRVTCKMKTCDEVDHGKFKYCFACDKYPCRRLRQLDKRYRSKYGMSMIENLDEIQRLGVRQFVRNQKERWTCPECGQLLSVHKPQCLFCGYAWQEKLTE